MQSRKTHASLTFAHSTAAAAALVSIWLAAAALGRPCEQTGEIISNNMQLVAGSGDTLWVASFSQQGWGVNMTASGGDRWWGYYLGCYSETVTDMALGGGTAAVVLNPADYATNPLGTTKIWSSGGPATVPKLREIQWPDSLLKKDSALVLQAMDVVSADGLFYLASHNGGLLRWDPVSNAVRGFLPGSGVSFDPGAFGSGQYPMFGSAVKSSRVIAVDRWNSPQKSGVVAVTPPRIWIFHPQDSSWDSSITSVPADSTINVTEFVSAFVNNTVDPPLLYAYISWKKGNDTLMSLFRYRFGAQRWVRILTGAPLAAAGAAGGHLYCISGDNKIAAYRDSVSDSAAFGAADLSPRATDEELYKRLIGDKDMDRPANLNDIAFVKITDSSGQLCVASSEGLFLSAAEIPGATTGYFKLLRRDRAVAGGLKETYARPGIITNDWRRPEASKTTFVYKLGRDAGVTIRVYDYNMQLVMTVVENAPRKAATPSGRSTDTRLDVWDGRGTSGRIVAPGVYYYKITTSAGERSFGKIVVAKGGE